MTRNLLLLALFAAAPVGFTACAGDDEPVEDTDVDSDTEADTSEDTSEDTSGEG